MFDFLRKADEKEFEKKKQEIENKIVNAKARPIINSTTSFSVREAYKTARTNIMFALGDHDSCKKIVFTSASPGEGKTTTCINIAETFAQRPNTKVLLVDGDLRRPRVNQSVGLKNEVGLSNLLASFCDLQTFRPQKTEYGFDCITAGSIPPNPSELLASAKAKEVFDYFSNFYDYIFIDTPPVTVVTDAVISNNFADGVVMVVRQNYTTYDIVNKAISTLKYADSKILGFILNDVESASYKYGSKYTNKYYKEQDSYEYYYGYGSAPDSSKKEK